MYYERVKDIISTFVHHETIFRSKDKKPGRFLIIDRTIITTPLSLTR